jgi:hypothetical protein
LCLVSKSVTRISCILHTLNISFDQRSSWYKTFFTLKLILECYYSAIGQIFAFPPSTLQLFIPQPLIFQQLPTLPLPISQQLPTPPPQIFQLLPTFQPQVITYELKCLSELLSYNLNLKIVVDTLGKFF